MSEKDNLFNFVFMYVCECTLCEYSAHRNKKAIGSPDLELDVGAGD